MPSPTLASAPHPRPHTTAHTKTLHPPPHPSNDYEKEVIGLTSALPSRISTLMNYESNEDKGKVEVRNIKTEIANAKQLLQDMEHTNRTIAEPTKRELVKKIGIHRETLGTLGKDLALAEQKFDRGALFGARGAAAPLEYDKSQSARDRATAATEKLRGGTSILEDAHRRVEETIDVGADTLGQLEENRTKMMRIRGNVSFWGGKVEGGDYFYSAGV